MAFKKMVLAGAALAASVAFAQAPLGTVGNVNGIVTATQGASGTTVTNGTVIQNGMRFVTTTNASATLNLNSGCTVNIPAGHGVTVLQSMTCQQLAAAVRPVVPIATGPAFPPSALLVQGVVLGGAAAAAVAGFRQIVDDNDQPLSAR